MQHVNYIRMVVYGLGNQSQRRPGWTIDIMGVQQIEPFHQHVEVARSSSGAIQPKRQLVTDLSSLFKKGVAGLVMLRVVFYPHRLTCEPRNLKQTYSEKRL